MRSGDERLAAIFPAANFTDAIVQSPVFDLTGQMLDGADNERGVLISLDDPVKIADSALDRRSNWEMPLFQIIDCAFAVWVCPANHVG